MAQFKKRITADPVPGLLYIDTQLFAMKCIWLFLLLFISKLAFSQAKKASEFVYKRSGFAHYTELGTLAGEKTSFPGTSTVAFSFQTVNGYRFTPTAMLGAGVGIDFYPRQTVVPVFASLRGDFFTNWRVIPFYFADAGYGTNITKEGNNRSGHKGGPTYGGGLGVKIPFSSRAGLLFSLGYKYQSTRFENRGDQFNMEYRRVAIKTGFFF